MFTAKNIDFQVARYVKLSSSKSDSHFRTPFGESSSTDEILFTKRKIKKLPKCTWTVKVGPDQTCKTVSRACSSMENKNLRRVSRCSSIDLPCNRLKETKGTCTEYPMEGERSKKDTAKVCAPPIPFFPTNSPRISELPPNNYSCESDLFEIDSNQVALESKDIAIITNVKVEVCEEESQNLKIKFRDDKNYLKIHLPKQRDPCKIEMTDQFQNENKASCSKKEQINSECREENTSEYCPETCNKDTGGKLHDYNYRCNNYTGVRETWDKECADEQLRKRETHLERKCLTECDEEEDEKWRKYFEHERVNKDQLDKDCCKDFTDNVHYRYQRAINPDTNVIIDGQEFPCHLMALQVYSKRIDEIRPKLFPLELPGNKVPARIFTFLMDWILARDENKSFVICGENVIGLYCASKYLCIPELNQQCNVYVEKKVSEEDPKIIEMWEETRGRSDCEELQTLFCSKLSRMFMKIYKSRQFLTFKAEEMLYILDNDCLCIINEMNVYDAVVRWLMYDWQGRKNCLVRLMRVVRFGLLTPLQLTQINHFDHNLPHYQKIFVPEVTEMIQSGLKYAVFSENYSRRPGELKKWVDITKVCPPRPRNCLINYYIHPDDLNSPPTEIQPPSDPPTIKLETIVQEYENVTDYNGDEMERTPSDDFEKNDSAARLIQRNVRKFLNRTIVLFGGCDPKMKYEFRLDRSSKVFSYRGKWEEIAEMPEPRIHSSVVCLHSLVYLIGGCDPRVENSDGKPTASKTAWTWNPRTHRWTRLPQMNVARSRFGCVVFNRFIYVFGGQDDKNQTLKRCEMYNPALNRWTEVAPLINATHSMAATKYNEFIWLIGGLIQDKKCLLNTISLYKPEDDMWTFPDIPFPFPIGFASAVTVNNNVYVLGGVNKHKKSIASVYQFDFEIYSWTEVGTLQIPRHAFCLVPFRGSAIIIGGITTTTMDPLADVEAFNWKSFESIQLENMPSRICGVAGVCI